MDNHDIDYRLVKKLMKLLEDSNLHEMKVKIANGTSVHLTKSPRQQAIITPQSQPLFSDVSPPAAAPPLEQETKTEEKIPGTPVASPMVGTFYEAPSPDSDAFVREGDLVKAGDILCVIEAMKMMNHIKAPKDGKVGKILARNAQPVEYGQHLMMIID